MIGNGWNRIFVSIRDAEHFVSDDAGTTRRAKRRGQGAVTGETKMGIKRIVNRKPISTSNRALPASFRLRSSPCVVGFRVSAEGPDLSPAEGVAKRSATRGAWTESLDRFWMRPEIFFAQCFQGSREDSG